MSCCWCFHRWCRYRRRSKLHQKASKSIWDTTKGNNDGNHDKDLVLVLPTAAEGPVDATETTDPEDLEKFVSVPIVLHQNNDDTQGMKLDDGSFLASYQSDYTESDCE